MRLKEIEIDEKEWAFNASTNESNNEHILNSLTHFHIFADF